MFELLLKFDALAIYRLGKPTTNMLTLEECLTFSELSEEEVHEIAEHEHLPEILAAALAHVLLRSPNGVDIIRTYFHENLERATARGDVPKVRHVKGLIDRFMSRARGA